MNIYYGIPSGLQINFEERETSKRLISALSALPCHTRDFTTDDPYPFEAIAGTPSLIHAFNLAKSGIQCQKLAEKSRLPLVISCSGLDVYADLFNPVIRSQLQEAISYATRIIVPFPAMARFIKTRIQTNANIEVIAPGIQPIEFFDFPREHFGFTPDERLVIVSGGLLPAKNPIFAIHSFDRLAGELKNLRLVILSEPFDPDYRRKVEAEIADRPWVKLIPRPEPEILPFLYRMAEVFINVSHAEGYNPCLLQAMQAGRPILAADIHGNNSYIRNETNFAGSGNGLLYFTSPGPSGYERIHDADDFVDKLRFLLSNPAKATELGQRAESAAIKTFSLQKELYLHLQMYKSILA
ncbi:MAG: glycosyltransferase family 4 protein [Candidatus Rifleibacteriota bacterium]